MVNSAQRPPVRKTLQQIAVLGNFPPRQCGIATFTLDLTEALAAVDTTIAIDTIAMSDRDDYVYSEKVCFEIEESDPEAYGLAAEYINRFGYDVLSVQHEYGIFGGPAGDYLMQLVREAKMPIITTLHTVLRNPNPTQKSVMDELLQLSERVVVMSQRAVSYLVDVHEVAPHKIDLIPHGIPAIPDGREGEFRRKLGIKGPMILTFGLLSPDKGIQYVIKAMPKIVAEHPGAVYVVVGATHPNVRGSTNGESYRTSLIDLAKELGVEANVKFVDRFIAHEELVEYLGAMDMYITPYLNPEQITSGTLAYAIGAGKAVISTPYTYAEDLLDEGRGVLVPFRDADAIAEAVLKLEREPEERAEMGRRAAEYGKDMLWSEVGKRYLESFARAKSESAERLRVLVQRPTSAAQTLAAMPEMKLDHLFDLSDDTGMLQHATFTVPNRSEGYCVDDNARALLLTAYLETARPLSSDIALLQSRYLSFVLNAFNPETGRFRNFMNFSREWLEESGSEDSHARSLWSLGALVRRGRDRGRRAVAKQLFEQAIPALYETTSPRTWAYAVLGADEYLRGFPHEYAIKTLKQTMASRLVAQYNQYKSHEWPWFEDSLSYANARLSQALILAGEDLGNQEMLTIGLESLEWLMQVQTSPTGVFAPIGTNGFYGRDTERNWFDQQPVEAAGAISACLAAARATGSSLWRDEVNRAFSWFMGENMLGQPIYDKTTGGCHDGMHEKRVNRNQGAESTLSFLCALAEIRNASVPPQFAAATPSTHELKQLRSPS